MSRWIARLRRSLRRRLVRVWTPRLTARTPVCTAGDTVRLAAGRDFRGG